MSIFLIISTIVLLYLIILFCELFTNAIEHLGNYFKIQDGALGRVFAAIGTAFPETILPLIAVIGAYVTGVDINIGKEIGKGAVLGSPFMLSTIAFFLVGLSICIISLFKKRKTKLVIDTKLFHRDLKFFTIAYSIGVLTVLIPSSLIQKFIGIFLIGFYIFYAIRTVKKLCCTDNFCENKCEELFLMKKIKLSEQHRKTIIFLQLFIAVLGVILSAHYFVENIKEISNIIGIMPMIISLFLAPVATELPEIINGMVWSAKNKDTLAISNITGAMVFQACIPMAIGIIFTYWRFSYLEIVNVLSVYLALIILYISTIKNNLNAKLLLLCIIPYIFYIVMMQI